MSVQHHILSTRISFYIFLGLKLPGNPPAFRKLAPYDHTINSRLGSTQSEGLFDFTLHILVVIMNEVLFDITIVNQ